MRRVLATVDAVGGVWSYALDLARGLAAGGTATTLALLGPGVSEPQRAAAASIPGLELIETGAALDWMAEDETAVRAAARLIADIAAEVGAELVHLNSPALAGLAAFPVPVLGACHSCLATWWDAVEDGPMPADFRWRTALLAQGYAACDLLVAPTHAFAATTRRRYGVDLAVVHNGAAVVAPPPPIADRDRLVLTGGRLWDDGKNFATLDLAASVLDAPLCAAGPLAGPYGEEMQARHARPLGTLTPHALRARMNAAPIFASLALYEPFGLTVLEAAQSGCALVLSDIATFRELWDGAAIFVPARQADAAAAVLRGLLDDAETLEQLGAAAAERAGQYTADAMSAGILALYRSLVERHPR